MSFCRNCGNELKDGDNFCRKCRTPVSTDSKIQASPEKVSQTTTLSDSLKGVCDFFDKNAVILIILTILAALIMLAPDLIFDVFHGDTPSKSALACLAVRFAAALCIGLTLKPKESFKLVRCIILLIIFAALNIMIFSQTPVYFSLVAIVALVSICQSDSEHKLLGVSLLSLLEGIVAFAYAVHLADELSTGYLAIAVLLFVLSALEIVCLYAYVSGIVTLSRLKATACGIISSLACVFSLFLFSRVYNIYINRIIINGHYLSHQGIYYHWMWIFILFVMIIILYVIRQLFLISFKRKATDEAAIDTENKEDGKKAYSKRIYIPLILLLVIVVSIAGVELKLAYRVVGIEPQEKHICNNLKSAFSDSFDNIDCSINNRTPETKGITYQLTLTATKNGDTFTGTIYPHYTKTSLLYTPDALSLEDIAFEKYVPANPPDNSRIGEILSAMPVTNSSGTILDNFAYDKLEYETQYFDADSGTAKISVNCVVDCGNYSARIYDTVPVKYIFNKEICSGQWIKSLDSQIKLNASIASNASITEAQIKSAIADKVIELNSEEVKYLRGSDVKSISNISVSDNRQLDRFNVSATLNTTTDLYDITADIVMVFSYNNGQYLHTGSDIVVQNVKVSQVGSGTSQIKYSYSGKSKITSSNSKYDLDNRTVSLSDFNLYNNKLSFKLNFSSAPYNVSADLGKDGSLSNIELHNADDVSYYISSLQNSEDTYSFTLFLKDISGFVDEYGNLSNNVTVNYRFAVYDSDVVYLDGTAETTKG
jgi:hypothetical protein